jgi:hypothetical protein
MDAKQNQVKKLEAEKSFSAAKPRQQSLCGHETLFVKFLALH